MPSFSRLDANGGIARMTVERFTVEYDGPALRLHRMHVKALFQSLSTSSASETSPTIQPAPTGLPGLRSPWIGSLMPWKGLRNAAEMPRCESFSTLAFRKSQAKCPRRSSPARVRRLTPPRRGKVDRFRCPIGRHGCSWGSPSEPIAGVGARSGVESNAPSTARTRSQGRYPPPIRVRSEDSPPTVGT